MSYTKEGMPYQGHSTTSQAAATSQAPRAPTKREIVYYLLRSNPHGLTDDEMQVLLKMNPSTQRPRRVELVSMRLVIDSGVTRKTRGGENAVVWRVKTAIELQADPPLSKPTENRCPTCGHKL